MTNEIQKKLQEDMLKAIESFKKEISKQRAGRAQPAMITSLMVNTYGSEQPLSQVATVTTEGPLSLLVKPWDRKLIPAIEKAIMTSDLGLNPATSGETIRVPFPALNEERRKEIVKTIKGMAETGRVVLRNLRRDSNNEVKQLEKDHKISEDEAKKAVDKIQEITDKNIKLIDTLFAEKEQEIMKI